MSVRPGELENPERDLDLADREAPPARDRQRAKDDKGSKQRAIRERLERARGITPQGADLHWDFCWRQGRDAAVQATEADGNTVRAKALQAPALIGCGDCFCRGRDAAIRVIEDGG